MLFEKVEPQDGASAGLVAGALVAALIQVLKNKEALDETDIAALKGFAEAELMLSGTSPIKRAREILNSLEL